ncbi:hypothetical protein [Oceanibacterium hippocampi]|uniref:Uncharacterized protein n=1 Tax=Oceanibacterium hippocampi TaxID=745714 RepID=A0A1Y5TBP4_9PROT|nr:hypothetical protein [Oceanibacterium hippocampi]SLN60397.1 hypothetical protein OCH7691_02656 [Oceanibacterium hippocampi]
MKAFLVAVIALVVVSGGAAVVLDLTSQTTTQKYTLDGSVRLGN